LFLAHDGIDGSGAIGVGRPEKRQLAGVALWRDSRPSAAGGSALARLDPRLDRLAPEPDGAAETDVRKAACAHLAIHPVGPHPKVGRDVLDLE
jgi:hypothetical protein